MNGTWIRSEDGRALINSNGWGFSASGPWGENKYHVYLDIYSTGQGNLILECSSLEDAIFSIDDIIEIMSIQVTANLGNK